MTTLSAVQAHLRETKHAELDRKIETARHAAENRKSTLHMLLGHIFVNPRQALDKILLGVRPEGEDISAQELLAIRPEFFGPLLPQDGGKQVYIEEGCIPRALENYFFAHGVYTRLLAEKNQNPDPILAAGV